MVTIPYWFEIIISSVDAIQLPTDALGMMSALVLLPPTENLRNVGQGWTGWPWYTEPSTLAIDGALPEEFGGDLGPRRQDVNVLHGSLVGLLVIRGLRAPIGIGWCAASDFTFSTSRRRADHGGRRSLLGRTPRDDGGGGLWLQGDIRPIRSDGFSVASASRRSSLPRYRSCRRQGMVEARRSLSGIRFACVTEVETTYRGRVPTAWESAVVA